MTCVVLGIFIGYAITSYFFFKFPTILHKPKKRKFRACHISHRGGAGERLENTLEAFRHAVSLGTDMLELDCHITKDGHVIVSHDNLLDRSAGLAAAISDLCLDQLPPLARRMEITFNPGSVYESNTHEPKFALLREVFSEFPSTPINIDIKVDDDELIRKVSKLIKEFNREAITVWGNHKAKITEKCYAANSNMPIIFSLRRVVWTLVLYYTGLLPFVPVKETFFEIPMPSIFLSSAFTNTYGVNWRRRLVINVLDKLLMRPSLIQHLGKRGITTFVWVCNTEDQFERAYNLGAEGVMTDYPTQLKLFLDTHPKIRQRCLAIKK